MIYQNAKDVLPQRLIDEIQQYVEGQNLYIPRKTAQKAGWGEMSGTKAALRERNRDIVRMHRKGSGIEEIAAKYYLSPDSIRKIIGSSRE